VARGLVVAVLLSVFTPASARAQAADFFEVVRTGTAQQVEAAIAQGADVKALNADNESPLHVAAQYNRDPAVIAILVKAGADPNARDVNGSTPLSLALERADKSSDAARALLQAGAAVNTMDNTGRTPLILALRNKYPPEAITAIVNAGADVKVTSRDAPLVSALANRYPTEVIVALLHAGAAVNDPNPDGTTPLMAALITNEPPDVVMALLRAGAGAGARTQDGLTSLMLAAANNHNPDVISMLVDAGGDVNARDPNGMTPLMYAVTWGAMSNQAPEVIVALLIVTFLNAGADAKIRDRTGRTAFDYAKDNAKLVDTDAYRQLEKASQ